MINLLIFAEAIAAVALIVYTLWLQLHAEKSPGAESAPAPQ